MEYKVYPVAKYHNTYVLRFERGEDIVEKLLEFADKEDIWLAGVSAIGACDKFIRGVYSIPEKKYYQHEFEGVFEITNLTGNLTRMHGKPYAHLHITCRDTECRCFGGHLNYARVSATCEMIVTVTDGYMDRKTDEETGINLFEFTDL